MLFPLSQGLLCPQLGYVQQLARCRTYCFVLHMLWALRHDLFVHPKCLTHNIRLWNISPSIFVTEIESEKSVSSPSFFQAGPWRVRIERKRERKGYAREGEKTSFSRFRTLARPFFFVSRDLSCYSSRTKKKEQSVSRWPNMRRHETHESTANLQFRSRTHLYETVVSYRTPLWTCL